MNTCRQTCTGPARFAVVALSCLVILLAGTPARAGDPDERTGTGLGGIVLMGPVTPGPVTAGRDDEAPFRAWFSVVGDDGKAARFESGDDGRFEIALPPGTYTVVPEASAPIP